jgi:glycogen operon protein
MLATLFSSRGTIMLTAGDEFGRSQGGNSNAYAQDNPTTWIDWQGRDAGLEAFTATLAEFRRANPALSELTLLTGAAGPDGLPDVVWLTPGGLPKTVADWEAASASAFATVLGRGGNGRLAVLFNRSTHGVDFHLPTRPGHTWEGAHRDRNTVGPRSVTLARERPTRNQ